MKKLLCLIALLTACCLNVFSQEQNPLKVQIIPPAPDAASLGKYIDMPVSAYTGLPKIEIPIYQLKSYELSLPISLSYHASGVKAEELASWVGAGWTLNAGGTVSRSIRGLNDEHDQGYLSNLQYSGVFSPGNFFLPNGQVNAEYIGSALDCSSMDAYRNMLYALRGGLDLEPDLFFFSLPDGQSGKFLFDREKNIKFIPKQSAQITDTPDANGRPFLSWTITGRNGIKYFFSQTEKTTSGPICPGGDQTPEIGQPQNVPQVDAPSTWELTRIETASGHDWIQFEYVPETLTYTQYSSVTTYDRVSGRLGGIPFSGCATSILVRGKRLSKITTKAGYEVEFIANTARADLTGGMALNEVVVRYKTREVKKVLFSYLNDPDLLMLQSVQEVINNLPLPAYQLTYYPEPIIGSFVRNTFAVDHWGYPNGAMGNTHKSPAILYKNVYYAGANREPDLAYCQELSLKEIQYPTGGKTTFEYELHDYSNIPKVDTFQYTPGLEEITSISFNISNDPSEVYSDTKNFTLTSDTDLVFLFEIPSTPSGGIPQSGCSGTLTRAGSTFRRDFFVTGPENAPIETLPAGQYTLTATFDPDPLEWQGVDLSTLQFYIKVFRKRDLAELAVNGSLKGGGLRIKKISSDDGEKSMTKTYQYRYLGTNLSSGKLATFPAYAYIMYFDDYQMDANNDCVGSPGSGGSLWGWFLVRTAVSNAPLSQSQGSYVGYDEVIEYAGTEPVNNGYTVYRYTNQPDDEGVEEDIYFPIVPTYSYAYRNGMLKEQLDYRNDNRLVRRMTQQYEFLDFEDVGLGMKAGERIGRACIFCVNREMSIKFYSQPTEKVELRSSTVYQYGTDENIHDETTTVYTYNAYDQIIKTEQTSSLAPKKLYTELTYNGTNHTAVEHKMSYYSTNGQSPYEWKDTQLITYHPTYLKPQEVRLMETLLLSGSSPSAPYQKRLTYTDFDDQGNVLSYQLENDPAKTTILWGYDKLYPIAQTTNGALNQVAHGSFETSTNEGGWLFNTAASAFSTSAKTGEQSYKLSNGNISTDNKDLPVGTYYLSFWASASGTTVAFEAGAGTVTDYATPVNEGSWTLYRKKITITTGNAEIRLSGTATIDELRLRPVDAQMTTYTYDPVKGLTSSSDVNGYTTYYEYDSFNRLEYLKDFAGNILKRIEYHYERDNN